MNGKKLCYSPTCPLHWRKKGQFANSNVAINNLFFIQNPYNNQNVFLEELLI